MRKDEQKASGISSSATSYTNLEAAGFMRNCKDEHEQAADVFLFCLSVRQLVE